MQGNDETGQENCMVKLNDGRIFSLGGRSEIDSIKLYNQESKTFSKIESKLPDGGRTSFACGVNGDDIWVLGFYKSNQKYY